MSDLATLIGTIERNLPSDFQWLVRSVDHTTGLYFANICHNETAAKSRDKLWVRTHVFQAHGSTAYNALRASWIQFQAVWNVDNA